MYNENVISVLSRLDNIHVRAVESTYLCVFGDETVIKHEVYWCENGEIIPRDRSLDFEQMMETVTKLPKSTWDSQMLHSTIFVNADTEVQDQPSLDEFEEHTNAFIISDYIDSLDIEEIKKPTYRNIH